MNPFAPFRACLICIFAALLLGEGALLAEKQRRRAPSAVGHTVVNPDYKRGKLPNGQWKPETYALGKGTLIDQSERDESLTALSFREMGVILADALLKENYVPTPSVEETDLVILVSWGKTIPHSDGMKGLGLDGMAGAMNTLGQIKNDIAMRSSPGSPAQPTAEQSSQLSSLESEMTTMMMMQSMSDAARRRANEHNARLLGYAPALNDAYALAPIGMQRSLLDTLIDEIETPRYFVILQAYDFRKLWKDKEKELLWMTRFSIRAKGRKFDQELADMASAASSLFGQRSKGLKRNLRPGRGVPGELEVIAVEEVEE